MQKGDSLSLGPDPRLFVDELHARRPAAIQHRVEIIDRKANVMNTRSALRHEARDRGAWIAGLQQLDQRIPGLEAGYAGPIRVIECFLGQTQYIPEEWNAACEGLYGDPNVGYSSAARG